AVFKSDVATLDVAGFSQTLLDCFNKARVWNWRHAAEYADYRYHWLLRSRRERPHGRRTAKERDERAPLHSITSSASATNLSGIRRPNVLEVLRLITSSNLVGRSTGKSEGFSPLRIRPT